MTDDSGTWSFEYNPDGLRVYRSNGTTEYKYYYNGDKLTRMVVNGQNITFGYSVGLFGLGAAPTVQITNKENAADLAGSSTYLGTSTPIGGIDLVIDKPIADNDGNVCGVQFAFGPSVGIDCHAAQMKTQRLIIFERRTTWDRTV